MEKLTYTVDKNDIKNYIKDLLTIREYQILFAIIFLLIILPNTIGLIKGLYFIILAALKLGLEFLIFPLLILFFPLLILIVFIWKFYDIVFFMFMLWKKPEQIILVNSEAISKNGKAIKWKNIKTVYNKKYNIIMPSKFFGVVTVIPKKAFKTDDEAENFYSLLHKTWSENK